MKKSPSIPFLVVVTALAAGTVYLFLPILMPHHHVHVSDNASLAQRVKSTFDMDLPALENSLALTPITTGEEPFILTYSIPLNMEVSTWTHVPSDPGARQRDLQLLEDGKAAAGYEFTRQTNGSYLVKWNTTFAPYGAHALQVRFSFGALRQHEVYGPKRTETVTNLVQWDPEVSGFGTRAWFHGFLHTPSADYRIDIFDTNKNLLRTITGHTEKGVVNEVWDLKTTSGQVWTGEELEGEVYITPTLTDTNGLVRSNAPSVRVPCP